MASPTTGKGFIDTTLKPVTLEMLRITPDAIVFGSGLFALLTLSLPYAVFFGSMLEASLLLKMIAWLTGFLNVHYFETGNVPSKYTAQCRVGFTGWTVESLSLFNRSGLDMFPSAPIFMISAAASYVFNTLQYQAKELQALGPAFATKYYFSLITLAALVIVVSLFRAYSNCDTGPVIIFSILFGLIVGTFLVFQNSRIFGENGPYAINLLGIPILKNRTAAGQKLYICPTTASG